VSPSTARWQQQINSSFDALVTGALSSPPADSRHPADSSDWRYAVEDLRGGVCLTIDDLSRKDWSLRHLEQRSDSRDSGLESDAAADRHHVFCTKKPQSRHSAEDHHLQHGSLNPQPNKLLTANLLKRDTIAPSDSPAQVCKYTEGNNYRLCGVLGKKKLRAARDMRQHGRGDELANCCGGYSR